MRSGSSVGLLTEFGNDLRLALAAWRSAPLLPVFSIVVTLASDLPSQAQRDPGNLPYQLVLLAIWAAVWLFVVGRLAVAFLAVEFLAMVTAPL